MRRETTEKIVIILTSFSIVLAMLLAPRLGFAQSPDVKRALNEVRQNVENLNQGNDEANLELKIETLKNVIKLSILEAEDLKVKFDNLKIENAEISSWRELVDEKLNQITKFYQDQQEFINNSENLTDADITTLALKIKSWRQKNYLPLAEQIQNYILITDGQKAIKITENRWLKIKGDLELLQKYNYVDSGSELWQLLNKSAQLIKEAKTASDRSLQGWQTEILTSNSPETDSQQQKMPAEPDKSVDSDNTNPATSLETSSSTATSSEAESNQLKENNQPKNPSLEEVSNDNNSSSTESDVPPETTDPSANQTESISYLVRLVFDKISQSYQVFIEMSNLVRELLK